MNPDDQPRPAHDTPETSDHHLGQTPEPEVIDVEPAHYEVFEKGANPPTEHRDSED